MTSQHTPSESEQSSESNPKSTVHQEKEIEPDLFDTIEGDTEIELNITNLGGIDQSSLAFTKGISLLSGKNATNRSSVLHSLCAVLGGEQSAAHLKTDADNGKVTLDVDDESFSRVYERTNNHVTMSGTPYCEKSALVDTFVALFSDNPARRAVETEGNLREVLMRPVDTDEIKWKISELQQRRDTLRNEIQAIQDQEERLPGLEQERRQFESELSEVENRISELENQIDEYETSDQDTDKVEKYRDKLTDLRGELRNTNGKLSEVEQKIQFREGEIEDLQSEYDEIQTAITELDETEDLDEKTTTLEREIETNIEKRQALTTAVEDLQSVIRINKQIEQEGMSIPGVSSEQDVTAALDPNSQTIECWTCGTEVERGQVQERIESLQEILQEQRDELSEVENRIEKLENEKQELEEKQEQYATWNRRLENITDEIEMHKDRLEELQTKQEDLNKEIEEWEEKISEVEQQIEAIEAESPEDEADSVVSIHQELTQLERKRGRLESKVEDISQSINEIEQQTERKIEYEEEIEDINNEIKSLRGRVNQLEKEVVETLNSMMDDILEILEYSNIERVWIERKTSEEKRTESEFELHIIRETEDDAVYEDSVATLSESEREVIGIIVGVAGYLVHEVHEVVPFLIIDSVEMIDAERMANLLNYIYEEKKIEFLMVAMLEKDAQAIIQSEALPDHAVIKADMF